MKDALMETIKLPMLVYTSLVGLMIFYWLIASFGMVDLDLSPDVDLDIDIDPDLSRHGANDGYFSGFFEFLNFGKVPMTIVTTTVIFKMWLFAYIFYVIFDYGKEELPIYGHIIFTIIAAMISLVLSSFTTRPLRRFFNLVTVHSQKHLVGKECIIKSTHVDQTYGQAEVFIDATVILLSVKCNEENNLKKGDKAMIMDFRDEEDKDFYIIKPTAKQEGDK